MASIETDDLPGASFNDDSLEEEMELLEAIYINELTIQRTPSGRPCRVSVLLHPATGDNVDEQYVCLTLECALPLQYPSCPPEMMIKNPRGLGDEHICSLRKELHNVAEERTGNPMLYELIELAKESLTRGNVPHGQCVVCLVDFGDEDAFTKTECYHYFHCSCLLRYIEHSLNELEEERLEAAKNRQLAQQDKGVVCPVCREPIKYDLDALEQQSSAGSDTEDIVIGPEIRVLQRKMAALYAKQKAQGGIIDLEQEQNKHLISQGEEIIISLPGNQPSNQSNGYAGYQKPAFLPPQGRGRGQGHDQVRQAENRPPSRGRTNKPHSGRFDSDKKRDKSGRGKFERYSGRKEDRLPVTDQGNPKSSESRNENEFGEEDYHNHSGEVNERSRGARRGRGRGRGRGGRWKESGHREGGRYWKDDDRQAAKASDSIQEGRHPEGQEEGNSERRHNRSAAKSPDRDGSADQAVNGHRPYDRQRRGGHQHRGSAPPRYNDRRGHALNGTYDDAPRGKPAPQHKRPPPGFSGTAGNRPSTASLGTPPGFETWR